MRWPRFAVIVLITAVLQAGLVDKIAVTRFNAGPNLLLTLMVFFAIRCNPTEAILSSFAIGLALDVISTDFRMGPGIISFGLFGTRASNFRGILSTRRLAAQGIMIFLIGVLTAGLSYGSTVNVNSSCSPGVLRINDFSASLSVLYLRVSTTSTCFGAMPPAASVTMPAADQKIIRAWINNGAQNN
jgi:cell shape-determining protein MreD